jgi:hypothetical protein
MPVVSDSDADRLRMVVERRYHCHAAARGALPVTESAPHDPDLTLVYSFDLEGYDGADTAYAWIGPYQTEIVTVIGAPPVSSARDAVRVYRTRGVGRS